MIEKNYFSYPLSTDKRFVLSSYRILYAFLKLKSFFKDFYIFIEGIFVIKPFAMHFPINLFAIDFYRENFFSIFLSKIIFNVLGN